MLETENAKAIANYLSCLSKLESNTSLLYRRLSTKTEIPIAKSLLLGIAQDSSKHSVLLKGISDSIETAEAKTKDCEKSLGQIWANLTGFIKEIDAQKEETLAPNELYEKLRTLESSIGEEYYVFIQMQTLELLSKMISKRYNVSIESIKGVFENILKDEDRHREILATLKELSEPRMKEYDYEAIIKHQPSYRWVHYPPNNL